MLFKWSTANNFIEQPNVIHMLNLMQIMYIIDFFIIGLSQRTPTQQKITVNF